MNDERFGAVLGRGDVDGSARPTGLHRMSSGFVRREEDGVPFGYRRTGTFEPRRERVPKALEKRGIELERGAECLHI